MNWIECYWFINMYWTQDLFCIGIYSFVNNSEQARFWFDFQMMPKVCKCDVNASVENKTLLILGAPRTKCVSGFGWLQFDIFSGKLSVLPPWFFFRYDELNKHISIHPFKHTVIHPYINVSFIHPCIHPSIDPSIYHSYTSIHILSIHASIYIHPSICCTSIQHSFICINSSIHTDISNHPFI